MYNVKNVQCVQNACCKKMSFVKNERVKRENETGKTNIEKCFEK